jgi:putative zinc finger protein
MDDAEHDPALLAAYLEDTLDQRERDATIAHLAACSDCRGAMALLARAAAADLLPLPVPPEARIAPRPWRLRSAIWLPIAASAVIATVIGLRLGPLAPASPDRRSGQDGTVARSPAAEPSTLAPAASPGRRSPAAASLAPVPRERTPGLDESLLARRGVDRRVGGKTFRWETGRWVDTAFEPAISLPTVDAKGPDARSALLARLPALAPYAGLGDRVVVVFEGTVYRFSP